ncbi:MAG: CHASE2 domain-containing protein [Ignavibacteria bacterium]|nr:CHASE2 domain-containing protein [Ignavibacteria bacterium]
MRKIFTLDVALTTISVFIGLGLLSLVALRLDFLNPIVQNLQDFELNDVIFSQLAPTDLADTNIVLVNIGNLSRADIAREIERINLQNPKVIGLDAFFLNEKLPDLDDPLVLAISNARNKLVLVSKLRYNDSTKIFDSLVRSHPKFSAVTGFANFITDIEKGHKTVRTISPQERINSTLEKSFAVKISEKYNSTAAENFLARGNTLEDINFRGNYQHFYTFDAPVVLDSSADISIMRGKIILLGYMGESLEKPSLEDVFFTPLNPRPSGRSLPDMYGIVVHANVISMILAGDCINSLPDRLGLALNILLAYCCVAAYSYLYLHRANWYDSLTVVISLGVPLLILFLQFYVFDQYRFKFNLTLGICAIAITGNVLEIYHEILKNWFAKSKTILKKETKKETQA